MHAAESDMVQVQKSLLAWQENERGERSAIMPIVKKLKLCSSCMTDLRGVGGWIRVGGENHLQARLYNDRLKQTSTIPVFTSHAWVSTAYLALSEQFFKYFPLFTDNLLEINLLCF